MRLRWPHTGAGWSSSTTGPRGARRVQEAPLLERWQARVARRGGTVLGVDALDVTTDARKFIREFHITYPVLRDRDGDTQKRFGVTGFPETIVLDRRGRVAGVRRGPVDDAFLRHVVPSLLRERQ